MAINFGSPVGNGRQSAGVIGPGTMLPANRYNPLIYSPLASQENTPRGAVVRSANNSQPTPAKPLGVFFNSGLATAHPLPNWRNPVGGGAQYGWYLWTLRDWFLNTCVHTPYPTTLFVDPTRVISAQGKPFTAIAVNITSE